jgi:hypothetical protein
MTRVWMTMAGAAFCLVTARPARAEEKILPSHAAEAFLSGVAKGEIDSALDKLAAGSLMEKDTKKLEMMKGQIRTVFGLFGKYVGVESLKEKMHGESIATLAYVMKFEDYFITWHFVFYQPRGKWLCVGVFFSDQVNALP